MQHPHLFAMSNTYKASDLHSAFVPSGPFQDLLRGVLTPGPSASDEVFVPHLQPTEGQSASGEALPACSASVVNTEEGVEGYNTDSEEESAYCVDDNDLDAAEDDRIVELGESEDGEDTESGNDGPQKINDDIAVQYEIIPTSLGNCGCASNNQSYKKRKRWPKGTNPSDCRLPRSMGSKPLHSK
ncbi:uncharacterized protein LOC120680680 [Panicum virgatum]|uniref:uncharacterized protein LOC120680680 n=1 Tax=Panicum virgatum TaxID=38727 RepID=UPI0019D5D2DD|nr:uncharacterized protein LOC120680680 [Panicum virgatum]